MAPPASPGQRLLQEHLERDAPLRERSVARFMSAAAGGSALVALALGPLIGWRLAVSLFVLLGALTVYSLLLGRALTRGWYSRAVPWVNMALEVSMPAVIFVVDVTWRGPAYALTAPPLLMWGTLVGLSALRGNRAIALCAGALAATESLVLYFALARAQLPQDGLVTLMPPLIVTRAALLFLGGVVTSVFVGHFNRRAGEAFAAARARDLFGKYVLQRRIGAGGMAEVYLALYSPEGGFEKQVAVKRILPGYAQNEAFLTLFRAEAELCSRLTHPNIVGVFDFGSHDQTWYLAMEYVDGLSLKRVLDFYPQGLPLPAVTFLGIELMQALEYLSRRVDSLGAPTNLVHRDVNPPNLLVSRLGEVKLADFGIARASSRAPLTAVGTLKGKPGYLAPEQITGEPLDSLTDVFAAGITLWEALTGKELFPRDRLEAVLDLPLVRASTLRPDVPFELDELVARMLLRPRGQRVPASEALTVLRGIGGAAAAWPHGQPQLAEAVRRSMGEHPAAEAPGLVSGEGNTPAAARTEVETTLERRRLE